MPSSLFTGRPLDESQIACVVVEALRCEINCGTVAANQTGLMLVLSSFRSRLTHQWFHFNSFLYCFVIGSLLL